MKMKIARDDIAEVLSRAARRERDSPVKAARARGISVSLRAKTKVRMRRLKSM